MAADLTPVLWFAPAAYLLGAGAALALRNGYWTGAHLGAAAVLGLAVTAAAAALGLTLGALAPLDPLTGLTLLLVSLLGWVITRYSRTYLEGEPGQRRYVAALMFTLAAVSAVVIARNLGVLVLAWFASSLGLHHLLTFYRDRPAARMAAHKKFLASRVAELCMFAALGLILAQTGSLSFTGIATHVASHDTLPRALELAALLLALAAVLKSAQLPLHGWLIQVMEAPTPVSALLHAGIVNIGGFVMIRAAELISAAPAAQALLVVVGALTAAAAGLVMMTRTSIKVRLAWSTCSQMGFMLMECGLGLYDLAYLHLVAHSLYKAHAFLSAGDTVLQTRRRRLIPPPQTGAAHRLLLNRLLALPLALLVVIGSAALWHAWIPDAEVAGIALFVVALGLAPLLWSETGASVGVHPSGGVAVLGLSQLYLLWHTLFGRILPSSDPPVLLALGAGGCLFGLYLLQVAILLYPRGGLARALYPWAYGGFYLDEPITRLTHRIWPARRDVPPRAAQTAGAVSEPGRQA